MILRTINNKAEATINLKGIVKAQNTKNKNTKNNNTTDHNTK